jgi:ABC-type Mn2+/Zn2+ transport system ATPase subunit
MVSHDFELVRRVADRVTVLNPLVVIEGTPDILSTADVRELVRCATLVRLKPDTRGGAAGELPR